MISPLNLNGLFILFIELKISKTKRLKFDNDKTEKGVKTLEKLNLLFDFR